MRSRSGGARRRRLSGLVSLTGVVACFLLGCLEPKEEGCDPEVPPPLLKLREPWLPWPPITAVRPDAVLLVDTNSDLWWVPRSGEIRFVPWTLGPRRLAEAPVGDDERWNRPLTWKRVYGLTRHGRFAFLEALIESENQLGNFEATEVHGAVPVEGGVLNLARARCIGPICGRSGEQMEERFLLLTGSDDLSMLAGIENDGQVTVWRRARSGAGYRTVFECRDPYACDLWLCGKPPKLMVVVTVDGRVFGVDLGRGMRCWERRVAPRIARWSFDPHDCRVALSGPGGPVTVYEYAVEGLEPIYRSPSAGEGACALLLRSGRLLAAWGDGLCRIYSIPCGLVGIRKVPATSSYVNLIPVPSSNTGFAIVQRGEIAEVYHLRSGHRAAALRLVHTMGLSPLVLDFSPELGAVLAAVRTPAVAMYAWRVPQGTLLSSTPPRRVPALRGYVTERGGQLLFADHVSRTLFWYDPERGSVQSRPAPDDVGVLLGTISPSGQRLLASRDDPARVGTETILMLEYRGESLVRKEQLYRQASLADSVWLTEDLLLCWRLQVREPAPESWVERLLRRLVGRRRVAKSDLLAWFELWHVANQPRKLWSLPAPAPGIAMPLMPLLCAIDSTEAAFVAEGGVGVLSAAERRTRWLLPRLHGTVSWGGGNRRRRFGSGRTGGAIGRRRRWEFPARI